MNNYKGLFTFDVDNHRYLPIEQVDGLISDMFYNPEPKKEQKEYWFIDSCGGINKQEADILGANRREIGNYFETEEEAEKAVEKLKIYNKLKQKGFVFSGWYYSAEGQLVILADNHEFSETEPEDLTELFGGKIC